MRTNYGDLPLTLDPRTGRATLAPARPVVPVAPGPVPTLSPGARYRSKTEARYAGHLEACRMAGQIREARYEALRFTLGPRTTLTPDFCVERPDRQLELHEVKGFAREDAWVKLKIAAVQWPWFRWVLVTWDRRAGTWQLREVPRG